MTDALVIETANKVFADTASFAAVQAAERDHWAPTVWEAATRAGLPWISVPESAGGVGGSIADAAAVLVVAGRHAAPIPLAETGLLAGWLTSSAGLEVGNGPRTVVPGRPEDDLRLRSGRLNGTAHRVPWAEAAERIVALVDGQVVVLPSDVARIDRQTNVAGEPRNSVTFENVFVDEFARAPAGIDSDRLKLRGALSRAALMAGALGAMAALTARYTAERRQFGRSVASFQAVQALVVRCAEEAALVDLAVQVAARKADRGDAAFEIASAKVLADDAARVATRAAHQAHGAIGMTQEYPLHHLSRRLWSWRAEYGDTAWPPYVGRTAVTVGADALYPLIADGS
jgi:acyl-CoA dehydrogenase